MERHYLVPTGPEVDQKHFLPLALVEVSHANKLELLEKSISASQDALPQTKDMLAHLRRYQPSVAQMFHIKGTAISQAPLRLLCGSSKQLQLDSPPRIESYIALSYCWHGPDWAVADCLGCPEMGWLISTAMLHGLLNQRESQDEGVWIDQYCINQQDPLDKQLSIGCMDLFYKSARKVVIILEDVGISEAEEVLLQKLNVEWEPKTDDLDVLARILIRILSARWFRRAWCSHELQLSNDLVFLLPAKSTPVEISPDDLEQLYSVTSDYFLQHDDLVALMVDISRSYDVFTRTMGRNTEKIRGRSLMSEFSDIHELGCSSQTDFLSIVMNISGLQVYFTGQIRSPNECRWILAMVALSTGDATVFGGVDEVLRVEDGAWTPSWLNWANDVEDTRTTFGYAKLRKPTSIKSVDQYQITLDLLDFTNSTLRIPSNYFYDRAQLLVGLLSKAYIKDIIEYQPYWMQPFLDPIEARRDQRFVVEILACSLECGIDWMVKQMSLAPTLAKDVRGQLGNFESRFWPMLKEHVFVESFPGSSYLGQLDNDKKILLLLYLYFILFYVVLGVGSSPSFLPATSRASPEEDNQIPVHEEDRILVQCLWLDIGLGNKALVALRPGVVEGGRLSMPVALSNGSCAGVRRLWFLKSSPEYEDKVGRLTEKFHMFTLIPITTNANVVKRRDQIVRQQM